MLKLAVIGAQKLLGRELVEVLEARDCSVLPLSTGVLTVAEEEGDIVVFAPSPALLEGLDALVLADEFQDPALLEGFPGRILDLRTVPDSKSAPIPMVGGWPEGAQRLRGRPAVEQVLGLLPQLVDGMGDMCGTHLRSIASLGEVGLDELMKQSLAVLHGEEPETEPLGYRAAFEIIPQLSRGRFVEIKVPVFHGDLLILHLKAVQGQRLSAKEAPQACRWTLAPPTSREVAVSPDLLAHLNPAEDGQSGVLTLGFDPVLWGALRPALRVLGL